MHVLSWKSTALQYFLHVCYKSPLHSTKIKMILKDNTCKIYLSLQPQKTAMKIMFSHFQNKKKRKQKNLFIWWHAWLKGLGKIHCSTFLMTKEKSSSQFNLQMVRRFLYSSRSSSSDLLDLFPNNYRILFSYFLSSISFVIVRATVYIWVTVHSTVNVPTPTFKPCGQKQQLRHFNILNYTGLL